MNNLIIDLIEMRKSDKELAVKLLPGSIEEEECYILYSLIRCTKPSVVVECGCATGLSTLCIADGLKDNNKGKLYTCDISPYYVNATEKRLIEAGLYDYVKVYNTSSLKMKVDDIDFLFLDSDHSYQQVAGELGYFYHYLTDNALVVLHDFSDGNVSRAARDSNFKEIMSIKTPKGIGLLKQ